LEQEKLAQAKGSQHHIEFEVELKRSHNILSLAQQLRMKSDGFQGITVVIKLYKRYCISIQ
jgi:hypothetical protein